MCSPAIKRLQVELNEFLSGPVEGITAEPTDSIFEWNVTIRGPPGSYYEGGIFEAKLKFPYSYPYSPPSLKFTTKIFHPNIYSDGKVCISILHSGVDPTGYESTDEQWSAAQSIRTILLSVLSLLSEPNASSPANLEAAKMWRKDRKKFEKTIQNIIQKQKNYK